MSYSEEEVKVLWQDYRKRLQEYKKMVADLTSDGIASEIDRAKNRAEILSDIRILEGEVDGW